MKISNVELKTLKEVYDTPLYIYDENHIENNMKAYVDNLKSDMFETEVLFASKALCIKEIVRMAMNNNMGLDVVSIGELITALSVNFPVNKIYFHGNNKSYDDLVFALNKNVGNIVVDNLMELELLESIARDLDKKVNILIRLNVGVEAHTHKFIVTAHVDSKFGVSYGSNDYVEMIDICKNSNNLVLDGFHSHIGSQIFELDAFTHALEKLIMVVKDFSYPMTLNIGGGFGVKYTNEDKPVSLDMVSKILINTANEALVKNNISLKKLCIEPGRSIVAEAGYTLYTIGFTKKTPNKQYYFIDGGMTDNIRPALYQAKYDADIDGKENEIKNQLVIIAGKCCESGDLIIENILLPEAKPGDLLITYTTGAYGYSMSSNYNKALIPAIVFVKDGKHRLVCKRQTYDELLEREI